MRRVFLLLLCLPAVGPASDVTIVVNTGKHPSAVAAAHDEANVNWWDEDVTDDTICTECFAATELRHYLCKMGGKDENDPKSFPIADDDRTPAGDLIVVGGDGANAVARQVAAGQFQDLGRDGFRIKTLSDGGRTVLLIGGATRLGTLYGAYGFLERLGVRWFAPGEVNECVPRLVLDKLPEMDVTEKPGFYTRGFWAWEDRGNDDFFDWMARNRLNFWNTAEKNHPRLKKLGMILTCGGHQPESWFIPPRAEYPYDHPQFAGDETKPPDPYPMSDLYSGDANADKKLEYCEAHPEWYGLREGRRSFDILGDGGDNFCTSNKDACDELMKNIVGALIGGKEGEKDCPLLAQSKKKPWEEAHWDHADSINFWTLDGGKWCECENCKALGIPTDRNLLLVHRLRQEIRKAMADGRLKRNVQVAFLAYADVIQPATHPLPADFDYDNCIATFFPICRCYVHCFDDPKCTEINVRYLKQYTGWALEPDRHYKGQLFIGEYYNVSGYKCLPIVFYKTMSTDIPYYYKTGARHFHYMHCTTKNWGTKALTNYQMARMLWKPDTDVPDLLTDYFTKRYGAAAEAMRQCYDQLEPALSNATVLKYTLSRALEQDAKNLFPRKHMQYEASHPETDDGPDFVEMVAHVDEARRRVEAAASTGPISAQEAARIAEDRAGILYAWNTLHFYDGLIRAMLLRREGKSDPARTEFAKVKELAEVLKADTTSCAGNYSSSHATAENAFQASYIAGAYYRLEAELGPADPSKMPRLDPAGRLTIYGTEFALGGQLLYHKGFRYGGKLISPEGNYLYAMREAPFHMIVTQFHVETAPEKGARLALTGMSSPKEPAKIVPIRITLNDKVLFEGEGPFPEGRLSTQEYEVPPGALVQGTNRLKIENTVKAGQKGSRPWFGVDRVEIFTEK